MSDKSHASELHSSVVYMSSTLLHLAPGLHDLPQAKKKIIVVKDEQTQNG